MPRKSVVRLTDRPDMTLDVYRGCKTTIQQQQQHWGLCRLSFHLHLSDTSYRTEKPNCLIFRRVMIII